MEKAQPRPLKISVMIFVAIVTINSLLARYAEITTPGLTGVSSFYPAVAFMVVFTLWFRGWGAIAAYLGCFISAGVLAHMAFGTNLAFSLADLWEVLIPMAAFVALKADVGLTTKKDWAILIMFGWLLNNIVAALWGSMALAMGGINAWSDFGKSFTSWFVGDLVVNAVLASLMLKYLTPAVRKMGWIVSGKVLW